MDSYRPFQDMLTGYRTTQVMLTAYEKGVFEAVSKGAVHAVAICRSTGMDVAYGTRFLHVLVSTGLLEIRENGFHLSDFSKKYLIKGASHDQTSTLEFEKRLVESWNTLSDTLSQGNRVYGTGEKNDRDYHASLDLYLNAMDNAARIRAKELWDAVDTVKTGVILDAGAGSGAFLKEFLTRHENWRGVFCDLPDVVEKARTSGALEDCHDRLEYRSANLLSNEETTSFRTGAKTDILFMSNIIHCQGEKETEIIFAHVLPCLSPGGMLIIHDFFTDANVTGSMYDLHMMLNTYNGKTYSISETECILSRFGMTLKVRISLPSRSTALVFS